MKEIPLNRGLVALVNDEDFEWLTQWKWTAAKGRKSWYAVRMITISKNKRKMVYMHRIILGNNGFTDHKDGNGLNNQRDNLRPCTNQQNIRNCSKYVTNTSGFKGVFFDKTKNKWTVRLMVEGKYIFLGSFDTPEIASEAYDQAAERYYGEYARTNKELCRCNGSERTQGAR